MLSLFAFQTVDTDFSPGDGADLHPHSGGGDGFQTVDTDFSPGDTVPGVTPPPSPSGFRPLTRISLLVTVYVFTCGDGDNSRFRPLTRISLLVTRPLYACACRTGLVSDR